MLDLSTAIKYYQAWTERKGDMSGVPLSSDFTFVGPMGTFEGLDEFNAMASLFGPAAANFRVREQFASATAICSIVQWELPGTEGTTTAAEILTIRDGAITRAELLYDPELVKKFMSIHGQDQ